MRKGSSDHTNKEAATLVAEVAIPPLDRDYSYLIPPALTQTIKPGYCVTVPLGSSTRFGYIRKIAHIPEHSTTQGYTLKEIAGAPWHFPHLTPELLQLLEWMAVYYGTRLSQLLDAAVPPAQVPRVEKFLTTTGMGFPLLRGKVGTMIAEHFSKNPGAAVSWRELSRKIPHSAVTLKRLCELGVLQVTEKEQRPSLPPPPPPGSWAKSELALTSEQELVTEEISRAVQSGEFMPLLLHGVTGSGKTEVYIEAVKKALALGKGALIMVPEIALTPQLIDRFRARIPEHIAILHSELPARERWESWRQLVEGKMRIALGARSAIFAPIQNLGLIVIDEEHESSYKQHEGVHYQARDVALVRGRNLQIPVILGSATPSLETFRNALEKKYLYRSLGPRSGAQPSPVVQCVDLNRFKPWDMRSENVSPILFEAIEQTLKSEKQIFLLHNRRGFAHFLQCEKCGEVKRCPHCSVTLTYHRRSNSLQCHYCHFHQAAPTECTACPLDAAQSATATRRGRLIERGAGTERVFEELQGLFPQARMGRLDRDAISSLSDYRQILEQIRGGAIDILVGTQMIAKGHDLPGVALVGIINADLGLHLPDFRASERAFQLLTQAAGRVGRHGEVGTVVLQTRSPQHVSIRCALARDFKSFAAEELESRAELFYPPFSRLLRIVVSAIEIQHAQNEATAIGALLHGVLRDSEKKEVRILGPSPAPLEKLRGLWRFHLIVKAKSHLPLLRLQEALLHHKKKQRNVRIGWDIDPVDML